MSFLDRIKGNAGAKPENDDTAVNFDELDTPANPMESTVHLLSLIHISEPTRPY